MHTILQLLEADQPALPGIVHQGQQRQYAQGTVRYDPRTKRLPVAHGKINPIFLTPLVFYHPQVHHTRDEGSEIGSDVSEYT